MEQNNSSFTFASKLIIGVVLLFIIGGGGFVGGMQYQKSRASGSGTTTQSNGLVGDASGQMGGRAMNGSFGSVTAISATSISVASQRDGTAKTYSISSTTTITSSGSAASYSDISVGDLVMVMTSNSTSTEATQIQINPTMGGPSGRSAPSTTTN